MAKYTVKFACGHEGMVELFGPESERERKLEWLAGQNCFVCLRTAELAAAKADHSPITAGIVTREADPDSGCLHLTLGFYGGTYQRKDDLNAWGASFCPMAFPGTASWHKRVQISRADVLAIMAESEAGAYHENFPALLERIRGLIGLPEWVTSLSGPAESESGAYHGNFLALLERIRVLPGLPEWMTSLSGPAENALVSALDQAAKFAKEANAKDADKAAGLAANPKP